MKKKVLITGATGFLGFHLLYEAEKRGLETYAAVRKRSEVAHIKELVDEFVELDYTSVKKLQDTLSRYGFDYIIHAAAMTRSKKTEIYEMVNVQFAENLGLAASRQINLKSFVFISSLAAIGPVSFNTTRITENNTMSPVTRYGESKKKAEEKLTSIVNLPLTVLRPTAIYGPREKDLLVLFKTILGGLDVYIGSSPQKLTFIHAEDAAKAVLEASISEKNGFYNLTDGNVYSRYDIADTINNFTGRKGLRLHLPLALVKGLATVAELLYTFSENYPVLYRERINEVTAENWDCDISAAKRDLHFNPKYNLETGLAETLDWYKKEKWI